MNDYRIGDVYERLAEIPDGSVDLIVTSPPFLALRSYLPADHPDKAKEIGSEPTPAAFLDTLLALSAEWRRVLAPHGSLCVELGDTWVSPGTRRHVAHHQLKSHPRTTLWTTLFRMWKCEGCGKPIPPTRTNRRYCTDACRIGTRIPCHTASAAALRAWAHAHRLPVATVVDMLVATLDSDELTPDHARARLLTRQLPTPRILTDDRHP